MHSRHRVPPQPVGAAAADAFGGADEAAGAALDEEGFATTVALGDDTAALADPPVGVSPPHPPSAVSAAPKRIAPARHSTEPELRMAPCDREASLTASGVLLAGAAVANDERAATLHASPRACHGG